MLLAQAYEPNPAVKQENIGVAACPKTPSGHKDWVTSVNFSPDGKTIVSSGKNGTVKLWNADGSERSTIQTNQGWVSSVNFSPDGNIIILVNNNIIKLWNADGTERATSQGNQGWVWTAIFSPDSKTIVSGGPDGTLQFFDWDGSRFVHRQLQSSACQS
jgi:WD40 repeat protein